MKLKLFITLFVGGTAYIIMVLSGLLLHIPLNRVLMRGVTAFVGVGGGSWIILFLMEKLADGNNEEQINNKNTDGSSSESSDRSSRNLGTESESQKQDFSPLKPPVLEVDGEDND